MEVNTPNSRQPARWLREYVGRVVQLKTGWGMLKGFCLDADPDGGNLKLDLALHRHVWVKVIGWGRIVQAW